MENLNNDLDKKHNYEVYSDKASKLLTFSIVFLVISLISYIIALLAWDTFDFGFIFELVALISIVVSKNALIDKKLSLSKKKLLLLLCVLLAGFLCMILLTFLLILMRLCKKLNSIIFQLIVNYIIWRLI